MRKLTSIAATGAATILFSSLASAQLADTDYDFQWNLLSDGDATSNVAVKGSTVFAVTARIGTAFRKCYGVDATQGGKNQSDNQFESTWFSVTQAYSPLNVVQGVDIGPVSLQAATESDLGGDVCLSPWFSSAGNTGGHKIAGIVNVGLLAGTAGFPFPNYFTVRGRWDATGTVTGPTTIGVDATNPFGGPLLSNVIYEVQGPAGAVGADDQYYLMTTIETPGLGTASATAGRGTGGVTNGNGAWGSSLFGPGAGPVASGAVSHTRSASLFGFFGTAAFSTGIVGSEWVGGVSFSTPVLWAENNGSIGAGGPDWNVASGTPSTVQLRMTDIQSGGQTTLDTLAAGGGGGVPAANFDANSRFNVGYFLWSETGALSMAQQPMSWFDAAGAIAPQAGSVPIGTLREGSQLLPIAFDALTSALVNDPALSIGTPYTNAADDNFDAVPAGLNPLFETNDFGTNPLVSGVSNLSQAGGAAFQILAAPDPALGGNNIGVAGIGVQVNLIPGGGTALFLTEFANGLTLTLQ